MKNLNTIFKTYFFLLTTKKRLLKCLLAIAWNSKELFVFTKYLIFVIILWIHLKKWEKFKLHVDEPPYYTLTLREVTCPPLSPATSSTSQSSLSSSWSSSPLSWPTLSTPSHPWRGESPPDSQGDPVTASRMVAGISLGSLWDQGEKVDKVEWYCWQESCKF